MTSNNDNNTHSIEEINRIGECEHLSMSKFYVHEADMRLNIQCDFAGDSASETHPLVEKGGDYGLLCDGCLAVKCQQCHVDYSDEEDNITNGTSSVNVSEVTNGVGQGDVNNTAYQATSEHLNSNTGNAPSFVDSTLDLFNVAPYDNIAIMSGDISFIFSTLFLFTFGVFSMQYVFFVRSVYANNYSNNNTISLYQKLKMSTYKANNSDIIMRTFIRSHISLYLIFFIMYPAKQILICCTILSTCVIYTITAGIVYALSNHGVNLIVPNSEYISFLNKNKRLTGYKIHIKYLIFYFIKGSLIYLLLFILFNLITCYLIEFSELYKIFLLIFCSYCDIIKCVNLIIYEYNKLGLNSLSHSVTYLNSGSASSSNSQSNSEVASVGSNTENRQTTPDNTTVGTNTTTTNDNNADNGNNNNNGNSNNNNDPVDTPRYDRISWGRDGGPDGPARGPWNMPHLRPVSPDLEGDYTENRVFNERGIPTSVVRDASAVPHTPGIPDALNGQVMYQMILDAQARVHINNTAESAISDQILRGDSTDLRRSIQRNLQVMNFSTWFRNQLAGAYYADFREWPSDPIYSYSRDHWTPYLDNLDREYHNRHRILTAQLSTLRQNMSPIQRAALNRDLRSWE